jgi:hypothetical protein
VMNLADSMFPYVYGASVVLCVYVFFRGCQKMTLNDNSVLWLPGVAGFAVFPVLNTFVGLIGLIALMSKDSPKDETTEPTPPEIYEIPEGYRPNAWGGLDYIPGGPADPVTAATIAMEKWK